MSKRPKLEGFSIPRPTSYNFERSQPVQRLYRPTDDPDLDDIAFSDDAPSDAPAGTACPHFRNCILASTGCPLRPCIPPCCWK
ncbi:Putative DEAD-box ATP-dependent RNA helicase family protein [Zea mays]|uniref:Putative DEAD-box ATP-dependent RNA helicase family protein n=1 Tax=Zea mays TaxID=4577 RepID=A0A1D6PBZ5_MAIZE|nr:Putative DEAD-box ATP-dependent RNA helicase family protein [Zea mays]